MYLMTHTLLALELETNNLITSIVKFTMICYAGGTILRGLDTDKFNFNLHICVQLF